MMKSAKVFFFFVANLQLFVCSVRAALAKVEVTWFVSNRQPKAIAVQLLELHAGSPCIHCGYIHKVADPLLPILYTVERIRKYNRSRGLNPLSLEIFGYSDSLLTMPMHVLLLKFRMTFSVNTTVLELMIIIHHCFKYCS